MQRFLPARPGSRLALFIALLSLATLLLTRPTKGGDFQEYALMTVTLAQHASPDIRLPDVDLAARLSPEAGFVALHRELRAGMQRRKPVPFPGFLRGSDGGYYAIHFFAYSALAAAPFKLFMATGIPPFKAFQVINLAALALLTCALYRFTGSPGRAMFGTLLFLVCGGMLYANWCSPEFFTACALLSALVFVLLDRPWTAGVLSGIAAMQNPPLVFFSVFAPLIRIAYAHAQHGLSLRAAAAKALNRPTVLASLMQVVLATLPLLYNLHVFGLPSAIGHYATDPALISPRRLASFYFDLNQGAIIGMPVVVVLVLVCLVQQVTRPQQRRWLPHTLAALLFGLALAIPSLSTVNWNSGANGMSRYALWGSMPLFFLALIHLQQRPQHRRWPPALMVALVLVQAGVMQHARSYTHVEFSPAARFMLATLPRLYAPDPEIFVERTLGRDGALHRDVVAAYPARTQPVKTVFDTSSAAAHAALCGPGRRVTMDTASGFYPGGWRYLDGAPQCAP